MSRRIVVLDGAKEDLREVRQYVKSRFGDSVWKTVNGEYKESFKLIKSNPEIGGHIDELKDLGITNVRYVLVRQVRTVYEFDESLVLIHMFIHTRRDFGTHLFKRLVNQ